ncbi:MAG: type 4a pilus biogenesis protein PilO [Candidatus Hydrothermales bacterium]
MDKKLRFFLITAGIGVFLSLVYYFLIHTKDREYIKSLEAKHSEISKDLSAARMAASRLPQLEIEIKKLQYLWEKALRLLPPEEKPEEVITLLQQRGSQNNVKIINLTRNPPVSMGEYTELPYSLEVNANFHDLVKFISELSTLSRLVTVEGITITQTKDEERTCKASFVAKFYSAGTLPGASAPSPTREPRPVRAKGASR